LTKYNVKIYKDGKAIIAGKRNVTNGLWNIPLAPKAVLPPSPKLGAAKLNNASAHHANGTLQDNATKQDLAAFLHACAFSPVPSTFLRAVQRGHFDSWPGLSPALITKYLPKSLATSKGHLRMQQQNLQSTKIPTSLPIAESLDVSPSQEPNNARTNVVFTTLVTTNDLQTSYSDQTGKFPVQSSRGYKYIMILYGHDSNAILAKPLAKPAALSPLGRTSTPTSNQMNSHLPCTS